MPNPETTQPDPSGFFTVDRRDGRWWLVTPLADRFFSLGINHIDSATLRYPENLDIWREKYDNSTKRWLTESVRRDLMDWGFNSVGWVQEVVTRGMSNHRHSRNFTYEEYQWLDLPYCHMLPFADFHQWEAETRHPDLYGQDLADWCDYVARAECARLADDAKLIGYFYVDCPTWLHVRQVENGWKGPLFDPARLDSEAGRQELFALATRWYQVTHDAIRRYDRHHLILGDRYEAKAPLPVEVWRAAAPYVDVLSFQHFDAPATVGRYLSAMGQASGKPVLLADHAIVRPGADGVRRHDPGAYAEMLRALREIPECVGYHLCGAYLRNRVRRHGLRDEREQPDEMAIQGIRQANAETNAWAAASQGVNA